MPSERRRAKGFDPVDAEGLKAAHPAVLVGINAILDSRDLNKRTMRATSTGKPVGAWISAASGMTIVSKRVGVF